MRRRRIKYRRFDGKRATKYTFASNYRDRGSNMQQDKNRVTSVREVMASEVDDHKFSDLYPSLIVVVDPFKSLEKLNTKGISCDVN